MFENLTVHELKEKYLSGKKFRLIDVREFSEYNFVRLDQSEHFPLDRLYLELERLPRDQEIVVYCHHGYRSSRACTLLIQNGFKKVFNLKGGIDEYSLNVDTKLKRY